MIITGPKNRGKTTTTEHTISCKMFLQKKIFRRESKKQKKTTSSAIRPNPHQGLAGF
jgi:signal recognition particle receptor subunit beta